MSKWWAEEVKLGNPSYGTTTHSQPLASHNFYLQTVLFCVVSIKIWHRTSLAAHSFTLSSHLKLNLHTGQLQVNSDFMAFWSIWLRGSLCTCPAHCSLLNLMHNTRSMPLYSLWSSWYPILHIPFSLTGPNIRLKIFLSKESRRYIYTFGRVSRFHSHRWAIWVV